MTAVRTPAEPEPGTQGGPSDSRRAFGPSLARLAARYRDRLVSLGLLAVVLILLIAFLRSLDLSYYHTHQSDVLTRLVEHIRITVVTLVIALAIAIPVGTLISRVPVLYTPVVGLLGILYTIPSLALLAFLVPIVGIGLENALIALVAYAQFILVRNVVVGLRGVDPVVIDAARGMGMSSRQILFKIEYPLALPVILGGLRIATVATIAIASVAALIDAGGLGSLLFEGINNSYNSSSEIVVGALAISSLAVVADILLRLVNRLLPASRAQA